jgi:hypothetical protein
MPSNPMLRAKTTSMRRVATVMSLYLLAPALTHAQTGADNHSAAPQIAAVRLIHSRSGSVPKAHGPFSEPRPSILREEPCGSA